MGTASSNSKPSLYPQVEQSHPDHNTAFLSTSTTSTSLYPAVDPREIAEKLFPDNDGDATAAAASANPPLPPTEETLVAIPGALLHLVDPDRSLDLGAGEFCILRLCQGDHTVAVLARLTPSKTSRRRNLFSFKSNDRSDDSAHEPVQWPLARDVAAVKLDASHYFFSLRVPHTGHPDENDDDDGGSEEDATLSYGLTFASKGQEKLLLELDKVLEAYTSFSVQKVGATKDQSGLLDTRKETEMTPEEAVGEKKQAAEERSAAFWTTIAPNVDDYSTSVARLIARGSGQLVRGILWCGDVTADGLRRGEDVIKKGVEPSAKPQQVKPGAIRRMRRARRITKMSNKVANAILSGVLKVSGFVTSSVLNSKPAQKFFKLMPGEVIIASLDGFGKIWDAVEVAGKNVMQSSSVVTTSVVTHRYGDQAGELTHEYLHATGHALGAAWAVFKIRKALDPKSNMKKTSLVNSAVHAVAKESVARQKRK